MPTADEPRSTRRNGAPRRQHGTSRDYLLDRLRRAGRSDLVEAVEAGLVSAYAVAVEMGWMRRPAALGTGSMRRQFRLDALLRNEAWEGET